MSFKTTPTEKKKFENLSKELIMHNGNGSYLSEKDREFYLWHYAILLGLNPSTKPILWHSSYNKKASNPKDATVLTVYATSKASKQFIEKDKISTRVTDRWEDDVNFYMKVEARKGEQTVEDIGFCPKNGFLSLGNAQIACCTKATRRAVLSISGTGLLDETEIQTMKQEDKKVIDLTMDSNTSTDAIESHDGNIDDLINNLENDDLDTDFDIDSKIEAITNDAMNFIEDTCDFSDNGGFADVDFG